MKRKAIVLAAGAVMLAVLVAGVPPFLRYLREERLLRDLDSGDDGRQVAAAKELARMGSLRAVPRLLELAPERGFYRFMIRTGTSEGPEAGEAAEESLLRLLDRHPGQVVKTLVRIVKSDRQPLRARALAYLKQGIPYSALVLEDLVAVLDDEDPVIRVRAAAVLFELGVEARWFLPVLLEALARDDQAGSEADYLVIELEEDEASLVPLLAERLRRWGGNQSLWPSGWGLVNLGTEGARALAPLVLDVDPTVSGTAVRILGFLRGNARAAVGALTLALERDTSLDFRKSVIHALSEIGPEAAPAVPALVRILRQGPDDHREAVLQALCSIGEPARIAAPAVLEALERGSTDVRAQAAAAVAGLCLGPEEALPSLLSALESPDDLVRAAAARALCVMGDDGISALPFIAEHLADPSPVVQVWAAAAIARGSREELDQHLPRLIAAVGAGEEEVWHAAVGSLGEIGAPARRAIPLLIHHLLAKPRWPVAMESVSKIGIDTEHLDAVLTLLRQRPEYIWVLFAGQNQQAMFPLLLDLLEQGNLEMRRYAGMFLGHQGPVPPSLVPRLRALITAPDSDVRQGAWRALQATLGRGFFLRDPGWRAWLEQPN